MYAGNTSEDPGGPHGPGRSAVRGFFRALWWLIKAGAILGVVFGVLLFGFALSQGLSTQIAGTVARRIVCYCDPGQTLRTGERIGMIRFGSRTELYVPLDCEIFLSVGQKVKGGLSLVGAYNGAFAKEA